MSSSEGCAGDSTVTSLRDIKPPRPLRTPSASKRKSLALQQVVATSFESSLNASPHWRADSIGPDTEDPDPDNDHPIGPAAAYDDATTLISRALSKLQETVNAKQFNPSGRLSLLSNVHAVLVISLLFYESSLVGINDAIDADLRDVLRMLWLKTTEAVKVNKYQSGSGDCADQSAAAARLSAALIEQNGQIRLFVDEIDRVWSLLRIQASKAAECVGANPQDRNGLDQTPLLRLVATNKPTGALRYRWRLARAVTTLGLERSLLKQSSLRLLDSLYYCLTTRVFSSIFSLPPLIDSYANPEQRIIILSIDCMSNAILFLSLLQSSTRQLPNSTKANRQRLKDTWKSLTANLTHQFFNPLSRNHKLSMQWSEFISRAFLLYIHFAFLLVARSDLLIEAAHGLAAHLHQVALRVHEGDLPLSASSNNVQENSKPGVRRWSWNRTSPSPSKETATNERGRALSENSFVAPHSSKEKDNGIAFSRKKMPPESRPPEGSSLDQEISALPLGCMLTSPRIIRTMQNVIRALPVPDALHLWTLLCITEVDENVLSNLEKECKKAKGLDWLASLAQEGASIFESRLGASMFTWDAEETTRNGRETFQRKANSVWSCLQLRFLDVVYESDSSTEDCCRQRLLTQEARWASGMIRVLGDSLLQCTAELALPLPLLAPRDVRPETDDLGDVFPFTPRSAPPPTETYETISIQSLISLKEQANMKTLVAKHTSALISTGLSVSEIEEKTSSLSEQLSSAREGLSGVEAKAGSLERQLIHLLEGPVARHSNQIKSFMDRFDSMAAEIRRLSGLSATQYAATNNQVAELKKQLESGRASKDEENLALMIQTEFDRLATTNRDSLHNIINQAQTQLQSVDQRIQNFCQALDATAMSQVRECQAELQEGQRVALSEALTSLKGLSASVEDLLHRAQNSEEENADHAQRHQMLEEMIRVLDLKQGEMDKVLQSQTMIDVPSRRGQEDIKNIRGMIVDLTNRMKMTEAFCQETDIRLTERLGQAETSFNRRNEGRFELAGFEEHFTGCLESLREECLENIQTLKKKLKHEYVGQLVAKTDELDQQVHALRLLFESGKTKSDVDDLPSRSAKRTILDLREWSEESTKQMTKALEGLQWNVADVRRSLDSIMATNARELDAVQVELSELRNQRENLEGQLRLRDQRLHALEAAQDEAKEERNRMANLLEKLDYGQRELTERFPSNDGGGTTRRKLSFWGAPFRREGRTQLSPSAVTWRQEERSKSKSPRPRLNSFLSSPTRQRESTKKHRQPVMEIPVCMRQNIYPPSPTSSLNHSIDQGGPISCGTGADGSVQIAPQPKHRLMFTAAMQSNNSV